MKKKKIESKGALKIVYNEKHHEYFCFLIIIIFIMIILINSYMIKKIFFFKMADYHFVIVISVSIFFF
jgi:hypothetical protein